MVNVIGQRELASPQGARPSQRTENERVATILNGSTPGPTTGQGAVFVKVTSTSVGRPSTSSPVFWIGGTEKPTNMLVDDFWFREDAPAVLPDPSPTDPVIPVDPGTSTRHSVFSLTEPLQFAGMTSFKEPVLRVASGFYTIAGGESYRAIGMRIWFPEGVSASAGTAYLFNPEPPEKLDIRYPTQSVAIPEIKTSGWHDYYFQTPLALEVGSPVYVGYEFEDGTYNYVTSSEFPGFTAPADGSKIYGLEAYLRAHEVDYVRSIYSANGGTTQGGLNAPFYGIDIIVDEGA